MRVVDVMRQLLQAGKRNTGAMVTAGRLRQNMEQVFKSRASSTPRGYQNRCMGVSKKASWKKSEDKFCERIIIHLFTENKIRSP